MKTWIVVGLLAVSAVLMVLVAVKIVLAGLDAFVSIG